ncbi:MAG: replicative DNA helicase [Ruminococcus sp.]|nr:replicative DNA helicase [Ruminococcus sp.]
MRLNEVFGKELPYSISAEEAVISGVLVHPEVLSEVLEIIKTSYFYDPIFRGIFASVMTLYTASKPIEIISVEEECVAQGVFTTQQMARAHLAKIMQSYVSVANIKTHCKIIEEKFYVRALITASVEIIDMAGEGTADAQTLIDDAEQKIYNIREGKMTQGLTPLQTIIFEVYDHLEQLRGVDGDKHRGTKTGFTQLDRITTGLNDTDLIILAARPAMGKSAFALNMAVNACRASMKKTVIFSLEMSPEQVASRILSSEALINNTVMRTGELASEDWLKLAHATDRLKTLPIFLDESAGITVPAMKAKLRRMNDLGLVVIDYLQLMSSPNHHTSRVTEVSEITRQLKLMAKELKVPVIALSQLSREAEKRTDKRPILSDLRESGSIEQDADIILFLYRDAYYDQQTADQSVAECIVAKNRHGQTDTVKLVWRGEYTLFGDPDFTHKEN